MGDHPNAELFRKALASFQSGDAGVLRGLLADDVVWHEIGGVTLHSADEVVESMSGMAGVEFEASLHDVLANDEHLIGLVEVTITSGDEAFTYRTAEINHVADGKITERWAFSDDTQRINDFFAQFEA